MPWYDAVLKELVLFKKLVFFKLSPWYELYTEKGENVLPKIEKMLQKHRLLRDFFQDL